jgi:hypothetical protein
MRQPIDRRTNTFIPDTDIYDYRQHVPEVVLRADQSVADRRGGGPD